jgi:hypothetical protein
MMEGVAAKIRPELAPGEKLLWSGKPQRGFMFHPASLFLVVMILFVFALVGGLIMINNTLHFVKVIEHLTSGASTRVFFIYLTSGFFILIGLVALWGFVFYPLERRKTVYALTDRRAIVLAGLLKDQMRSFDLKTINFSALTREAKGKATIIFGQVGPEQYGANDAEQRQREIKSWGRFGYRFELFEVGEQTDASGEPRRRAHLGRFEFIEDPKTVYALLRERVTIIAPAQAAEVEQPKITSFVDRLAQRPGTITFIIDVSGSMQGSKLDRAKEGLLGALTMADNHRVGLISFSDGIEDMVQVAPLALNRALLVKKVAGMSPRGSTALFDAIKKGIEMTDSAGSGDGDIGTLVVLTDGQANVGNTRLDDLLLMTTRDGKPLSHYSGLSNDAADWQGRHVGLLDVKGKALLIPTRHPVRIFFIGIGADADMEIGRILAEATGAESERAIELQGGVSVPRVRRVRELDIARVLEEFKYF